jgi:RNA polymerase sigma-70 factor (ECF subfamily)
MWQNDGMSVKNHAQHEAESWLNQHGDYLYRYALLRLRNEELSREMVQETLLAAWKARQGFRSESSVRTWLVGILKHKITDHIRKQIRERDIMNRAEADPTSTFFDSQGHWKDAPVRWNTNPEELLNDQQFMKVLASCISRLSEQQQTVFSLRELNGEDTETICNACDISPTNMHVIMHRARLLLRKCLEQNWFGCKKGGRI